MTPIKLLTTLCADSLLVITKLEAKRLCANYWQFCKDEVFFTDGITRNWVECQNCGGTHRVTPVNGISLLTCTDPDVEDTILDPDELKTGQFQLGNVAKWVSKQLNATGDFEKITDYCWYLGSLQAGGKTRKIYFAHTQHIVDAPDATGRVVLTVGESLHAQYDGAINILEYIIDQTDRISLDRQKLIRSFSNHQAMTGEVDKISDNLYLNKNENGKCFMRFGKVQNGQFEHNTSIKPQAFNIIYHLFKLPSSNAKKSSAQMEKDGLASHRRTITTRISEVNNLFAEKKWHPLILRDGDNQHYINPKYRT